METVEVVGDVLKANRFLYFEMDRSDDAGGRSVLVGFLQERRVQRLELAADGLNAQGRPGPVDVDELGQDDQLERDQHGDNGPSPDQQGVAGTRPLHAVDERGRLRQVLGEQPVQQPGERRRHAHRVEHEDDGVELVHLLLEQAPQDLVHDHGQQEQERDDVDPGPGRARERRRQLGGEQPVVHLGGAVRQRVLEHAQGEQVRQRAQRLHDQIDRVNPGDCPRHARHRVGRNERATLAVVARRYGLEWRRWAGGSCPRIRNSRPHTGLVTSRFASDATTTTSDNVRMGPVLRCGLHQSRMTLYS